MSDPVAISRRLAAEAGALRFGPPVAYVYNPLVYARRPHELYLSKHGMGRKRVLFLGMNPGPWGMAQTGVPFGEAALVKNWVGVCAAVDRPKPEHPKRPVLGFAVKRSEVSGARLWGWAKDTFTTAERFFKEHLILNFCPLSFMEASGRNLTPDKLPLDERKPLFAACAKALRASAEYYRPEFVVGVGAFARKRAEAVLGDMDLKIVEILHPSPASPAANRGWAAQASRRLKACGILREGR